MAATSEQRLQQLLAEALSPLSAQMQEVKRQLEQCATKEQMAAMAARQGERVQQIQQQQADLALELTNEKEKVADVQKAVGEVKNEVQTLQDSWRKADVEPRVAAVEEEVHKVQNEVKRINSWRIADKEELQDLRTSCEAQDESLAAFRQQLAEDRRASLIQPQSPEDMAELVVGLLQRNEDGKYSNLRADLVNWVLTDRRLLPNQRSSDHNGKFSVRQAQVVQDDVDDSEVEGAEGKQATARAGSRRTSMWSDEASRARTKLLTASEVLDPYLEEQCEKPEGDEASGKDVSKEKDMPESAFWYGKRTMFPTEDYKNQGLYQALEQLQLYFKHARVLTERRRIALLEKSFARAKDQQHLISMIATRERTRGRTLSYPEVRQLALDLFSPNDWLKQSIQCWLKCLFQGSVPGTNWLASFTRYTTMMQKMMPDGKTAISDEFQALLLRAGVAEKVGTELGRIPYELYNVKEAMDNIYEAARRLPNEGADGKADCNRISFRDDDSEESRAALKLVRGMAELNRTAVVYQGALGELCKQKGISQAEFDERKLHKQCVWCGASDHFLFSCPDYATNGLQQAQQLGQKSGWREGKRDYKKEMLTRAGAHRHFRRTGEVVGAHAKINKVDRHDTASAGEDQRGRTAQLERSARMGSKSRDPSSSSSIGSGVYGFFSDSNSGDSESGNESG